MSGLCACSQACGVSEVRCVAVKNFTTEHKHNRSATAWLLHTASAIASLFSNLSLVGQCPKPSPLQGLTSVCSPRHVGANPLQVRSSCTDCKWTAEQAHASSTFYGGITWPCHTFQPPGRFVLSKLLPAILVYVVPTSAYAISRCVILLRVVKKRLYFHPEVTPDWNLQVQRWNYSGFSICINQVDFNFWPLLY